MATSKLELRLSQLVHNGYTYVFEVQLASNNSDNVLRTDRKKLEVKI